ncbi:hypothetical protein BB561_003424 [Smittium simulii]|uniref:Uncharacterized protein n=1 Tax=Smittium simulii TaxID=133385 RepID=A0A2T9YLH2_9FUNG|nr:hypothetical protein BB561_003424 [Smittium simulii]
MGKQNADQFRGRATITPKLQIDNCDNQSRDEWWCILTADVESIGLCEATHNNKNHAVHYSSKPTNRFKALNLHYPNTEQKKPWITFVGLRVPINKRKKAEERTKPL